MRRRAVLAIAVAASSCVFAVLMLEAILAFVMVFPRFAPRLPALKQSYHYGMTMIQWSEPCSRYDAELTYTLRPGACTFANREFSTEVRVNSAGLRDDEESLKGPRLVAIGDSVTMGWGVDSTEAYPELIARAKGWKVLDAGVSSYGTARERRLLDRIDLSSATHLIIQYDTNDVEENRRFAQAGTVRSTLSAEAFQAIQRDHAHVGDYYPLRFVRQTLGFVVQQWTGRGRKLPEAEPDAGAADFLNALEKAGRADLSSLHIVVFALGRSAEVESFSRRLRASVADPDRPAWVKRIEVVDVAGSMSSSDFFKLDNHPNALGQRKIASLLLPSLN